MQRLVELNTLPKLTLHILSQHTLCTIYATRNVVSEGKRVEYQSSWCNIYITYILGAN
jgi:hypothetical protein